MSDTCFNCGQKLPRRVACPKRIMGHTIESFEDWLAGSDAWQSVEDVLLDAADTSHFNFSDYIEIEIDWIWERFDVGTKVGIRKALAHHLRFERKLWKRIDQFVAKPLRFVAKEAE